MPTATRSTPSLITFHTNPIFFFIKYIHDAISNGLLVFIEETQMKIDFDSIVKAAAATINEKDVQFAAHEVECQINGRAWNMNRPLNMIAYEDQQ